MGAGAVDAKRAVDQLSERFKPGDATPTVRAWDYGTAVREAGQSAVLQRYALPKLKGGTYVSATLVGMPHGKRARG